MAPLLFEVVEIFVGRRHLLLPVKPEKRSTAGVPRFRLSATTGQSLEGIIRFGSSGLAKELGGKARWL